MIRRTARLVIPGLLIVAGIANAKPPGPYVDPHMDGRESSPIEREHFQLASITSSTSFYTPSTAEQTSMAGWWEWLQSVMKNGLTIPLGTVEVPGD